MYFAHAATNWMSFCLITYTPPNKFGRPNTRLEWKDSQDIFLWAQILVLVPYIKKIILLTMYVSVVDRSWSALPLSPFLQYHFHNSYSHFLYTLTLVSLSTTLLFKYILAPLSSFILGFFKLFTATKLKTPKTLFLWPFTNFLGQTCSNASLSGSSCIFVIFNIVYVFFFWWFFFKKWLKFLFIYHFVVVGGDKIMYSP